jgi:hypothetical protein
MSQQVPQGFRITESAWTVIRSLVRHPRHLAYVCWMRHMPRKPGDPITASWTVVSYEERDFDNPAELEGVRFMFDPSKRDELIGKTLDWIDGDGFHLA